MTQDMEEYIKHRLGKAGEEGKEEDQLMIPKNLSKKRKSRRWFKKSSAYSVELSPSREEIKQSKQKKKMDSYRQRTAQEGVN